MDALYEIGKHFLRYFEIGNNALHQGADRDNMRRRSSHHPPRRFPHRHDLSGFLIEGDHRGLIDNDSPPPHIDQGIGRPEVNPDVVRPARKKLV